MVVFQSSLPSLGVASLKNRETGKISNDKEIALLRPVDHFYKNLALGNLVVFCFSHRKMELTDVFRLLSSANCGGSFLNATRIH